MAKVSFSKLGLKKKEETSNVKINDIDVEVIQYLPVNDKLGLITDVLNNILDNNNFTNHIKFSMMMDIFIIKYYTNISFTDKQLEDLSKLYDLMEENKIFDTVKNAIPEDELDYIWNNGLEIVDGYYKYKNSLYGIMENVNIDTEKLANETEEIQNNLSNPDNLRLVKDVLTKMG